jgi:hypothetical protein
MYCDEDSRVTKKATMILKFGSKTQLFTRALLCNTKLMSRRDCSLLSPSLSWIHKETTRSSRDDDDRDREFQATTSRTPWTKDRMPKSQVQATKDNASSLQELSLRGVFPVDIRINDLSVTLPAQQQQQPEPRTIISAYYKNFFNPQEVQPTPEPPVLIPPKKILDGINA